DSDVRLPVASVPALPDARYADLRVRDAVAVLDSARADVPDRRPLVPEEPPGRALELRDPAPGHGQREHSPRRDAAYRDVEAQLDLGDDGADDVFSAGRICCQEGASVDPLFWLGGRAFVADYQRSQGRNGRDAADRASGSRTVQAGLLDCRLS